LNAVYIGIACNSSQCQSVSCISLFPALDRRTYIEQQSGIDDFERPEQLDHLAAIFGLQQRSLVDMQDRKRDHKQYTASFREEPIQNTQRALFKQHSHVKLAHSLSLTLTLSLSLCLSQAHLQTLQQLYATRQHTSHGTSPMNIHMNHGMVMSDKWIPTC
jgi:hypothetical protein